LEAPPPSEAATGKTPTAPPQRCEGVDGGGSKTTPRRAPTPERRSTARKLQPPRLHLQDADDLQPQSSYTMYRTRDGDPPASRRPPRPAETEGSDESRRRGGVLRWP
jgi:hypothetical protein